MMLNQNTVIALLVIDGIGALVTIGFGVAAFIAWRKTKKAAETARHKLTQVLDVTSEFLTKLKSITDGDSKAA